MKPSSKKSGRGKRTVLRYCDVTYASRYIDDPSEYKVASEIIGAVHQAMDNAKTAFNSDRTKAACASCGSMYTVVKFRNGQRGVDSASLVHHLLNNCRNFAFVERYDKMLKRMRDIKEGKSLLAPNWTASMANPKPPPPTTAAPKPLQKELPIEEDTDMKLDVESDVPPANPIIIRACVSLEIPINMVTPDVVESIRKNLQATSARLIRLESPGKGVTTFDLDLTYRGWNQRLEVFILDGLQQLERENANTTVWPLKFI